MRRIAAGIALALTVAAQAAAKEPVRAPVLVIDWKLDQGTLVSVDPVSLERASDRALPLGTLPQVLARSPDGRHVAVLEHTGYPQLLVVDTQRMAVTRTLRTGYALGAAWLRPHRLLFVEDPGLLGIVDPLRPRAVRWKFFSGSVLRWARTQDSLLVLSGPARRGVGTAKLFVISADGGIRAMQLPGIAAGLDYEHERVEVPALAVDPAGERAVVVSGCLCAVVEVNLRSRAVRLHALAARQLAKAGSGPMLTAAWLRDDRVAVAGTRLEEHQSSPLGLALLDTHNWSLRRVDPRAAYVVRAGDGVIALGTPGLTAYSVDGLSGFSDPKAWSVSVSGTYAYVRGDGATDVVDIATGSVIATTPKQITVVGDL
jgi:hypothetical protein